MIDIEGCGCEQEPHTCESEEEQRIALLESMLEKCQRERDVMRCAIMNVCDMQLVRRDEARHLRAIRETANYLTEPFTHERVQAKYDEYIRRDDSLAKELSTATARAEAAEREVERLRGLAGVREAKSISIHYMHDNHTFSRLDGDIDTIVAAAKRIALESSYGMIGAATLLDGEEKQIRRIGQAVHVGTDGLPDVEFAKWCDAVMADPDAARLLEAARIRAAIAGKGGGA